MATTFPSTEDVKSYLRNEKPTEDDALYADAIDAAIEWLSDRCARSFAIATGTPAARTFVADCQSTSLYIGDAVSVTSVVEDGTTLTLATNYQLEPVNRFTPAGIALPYNSIRRLDSYWYTYGGRGTVVVTADWGWADLPARIIESVKILAKDIIATRDVQFGIVGFDDSGAVSPRMNPIVRAAIETYRGPKSWGIA